MCEAPFVRTTGVLIEYLISLSVLLSSLHDQLIALVGDSLSRVMWEIIILISRFQDVAIASLCAFSTQCNSAATTIRADSL